jgi:hypothetical protein
MGPTTGDQDEEQQKQDDKQVEEAKSDLALTEKEQAVYSYLGDKLNEFEETLDDFGDAILSFFNGEEGSIPGGTHMVGDTAGEESSQTTSTEGADETQVPYLGAAGALGSKTTVGKSLAEAIGKGNDVLRETKTTGSSTNSANNEIDNSGNSSTDSPSQERVLISASSGFLENGGTYRDSVFSVGPDSTHLQTTKIRNNALGPKATTTIHPVN